MTIKTAPYLAAAAIALALPVSSFAQSTSPAMPGTTPTPPEIQAPSQAPSMNDRVAPGGLPSNDATRQMKQPFEATELKGKAVYDAAGKKLGSIDEVVPQSGQTREAVVEVGGILGIGAKKVLIPASDIARADDGRLVVAMSEDQVEKLPEYEQSPRPTAAPRR